ncbi:DNA-binding response regulator [Chloroflexota bacterium]
MVMNLEMPNKTAFVIPPVRFEEPKREHKNIVVISVYENEADLMSAIKSGTTGYILNNSNPQQLAQALLRISNSSKSDLHSVDTMLVTEYQENKEQKEEPDNDLSKREEEVLQLVAKGTSNREIASTLFISENTVKTHLRNIMNKLGVTNRSQAAVYAVKVNLVR